jgi:hypothetical protein
MLRWLHSAISITFVRISWAAGWCEIDLAVRRHADQLTAAK